MAVDRCAGIDWAKETHRVCVLEGDGGLLVRREIVHDERGVDGLCELLVELGVKRVAIERPDGVLVGRLLEAGLVVLSIHPKPIESRPPAL
jgi:transposase